MRSSILIIGLMRGDNLKSIFLKLFIRFLIFFLIGFLLEVFIFTNSIQSIIGIFLISCLIFIFEKKIQKIQDKRR